MSDPAVIVADLPSGEPIPQAASASASASAPVVAKKPKGGLPLGALLAAAPSSADAFLTRLNKCLSTPTGIDTVMLLLCYTSSLTGTVLEGLSRSALRRSAREWIALIASLPRGTTSAAVVIKAAGAELPSGAATTAAAAAALVLAKRLKALAALLSEARTILRLWALLGMYFWGKGLAAKALAAWQKKGRKAATYAEVTAESKEVAVAEKTAEVAPETTALDATIAWTQLLLCVSLQTLENGAYLSSKGVLGWSPATQGKAFKWSARFWAAYTGIELGRLAVEGLSTSKAAKARTAEETADWRRKFARNLAWAPLTVHWSSEKGLVGDLTVGLLGSIPGIIQIRELWASTAGEA